MEYWASILTLTFDTIGTAELSAQRPGQYLPQKEFLGTHFCLTLTGPQCSEYGQKN
jgi:hypothetical protein